MIILRYLLFPFSILYGWITAVRNFLYDVTVLKSHSFDIPIIAVGNLSVGGTGKTPQIEYLIRLLSPNYKIATLSRGYKRNSKGFILADKNATAETLGDEPFQMAQKFSNCRVAVDANRKNGIEQLLRLEEPPQLILLDDAFQHRKVKAGFYILLSAYDDLFYHDWMMPTGNLREGKKGARRADLIVITKCPRDLSASEQENIKKKIAVEVPVYFSFIDYDDKIFNTTGAKSINEIKGVDKLLLAGIAKPKPFFEYLQAKNDAKLEYPDHHNFTQKDIQEIKKQANNRLLITTEKDYVRLKGTWKEDENLYYLPIKSSFLSDGADFDEKILDYVGSNIRQ